jgi:alkanesulfonate monooxygenase SsuD/methylene tetrahydromethanopterin reductase-like flavin-dependent oxidoreductase (luciferase family)
LTRETGGYDVYQGPRNLDPAIRSAAQWPVNEPLAVVPAMAAATKSIGIGVTVATTYEQPYHLARRLSTIDHLSKGRFGWNIVSVSQIVDVKSTNHDRSDVDSM